MVKALNLRQLRQRKNLTLEKAGAIIGVGKNNVWQWEVGRVNPRDMWKFNILLKAYDVHLSPEDLIQLDKAMRQGTKVSRICFKVVTE